MPDLLGALRPGQRARLVRDLRPVDQRGDPQPRSERKSSESALYAPKRVSTWSRWGARLRFLPSDLQSSRLTRSDRPSLSIGTSTVTPTRRPRLSVRHAIQHFGGRRRPPLYTVSYELLSSKHEGNSLADTAGIPGSGESGSGALPRDRLAPPGPLRELGSSLPALAGPRAPASLAPR